MLSRAAPRLVQRSALGDPGCQAALRARQSVQLEQPLFIGENDRFGIADEDRRGDPAVPGNRARRPHRRDQHGQRARSGGARDRETAAGTVAFTAGGAGGARDQGLQRVAFERPARREPAAPDHQPVTARKDFAGGAVDDPGAPLWSQSTTALGRRSRTSTTAFRSTSSIASWRRICTALRRWGASVRHRRISWKPNTVSSRPRKVAK